MIDICQWRRSIGLFRGRTASSAGKQVVVVLSEKRPTLKVGIVCYISLLTLFLFLAGDVEKNPGPKEKTGELERPESLANNETVCSCFSCRIITGSSE